jgi:hypothetical protein
MGSISPTFYFANFMCADHKNARNTVNLSVIFVLLGSMHSKAARKMLVKFTPLRHFLSNSFLCDVTSTGTPCVCLLMTSQTRPKIFLFRQGFQQSHWSENLINTIIKMIKVVWDQHLSNYSRIRLMWSLWASLKVITLTE